MIDRSWITSIGHSRPLSRAFSGCDTASSSSSSFISQSTGILPDLHQLRNIEPVLDSRGSILGSMGSYCVVVVWVEDGLWYNMRCIVGREGNVRLIFIILPPLPKPGLPLMLVDEAG